MVSRFAASSCVLHWNQREGVSSMRWKDEIKETFLAIAILIVVLMMVVFPFLLVWMLLPE